MEPAKAGFHKILKDILRRAPAEDAALIAWRLVCGPAVAEKTHAREFRDGILRVEVPDAAWRSNLESFRPQYLEALNEMLGRKVAHIEFVLPQKKKKIAGSR